MDKRGFAYLRVSGKGQVDGDGFDRQILAIRKYATANGIKIVKVFREEGVCGANDLENRPALTELYAGLATDGVNMVLVENLQRLARDLMVQESLIASFKRKGFELVSVTEPDILEEEPSRVLMRHIFGAINQYEKAMIVGKLRGARQRMKARAGRCEGRKPYGYHAGEDAILGRMRMLREAGTAVDTIASALNAEGTASRSGGLWYGSTVNKILKANAAI
jgi:DNA invertase Pin-like site-specific DNA recombinase